MQLNPGLKQFHFIAGKVTFKDLYKPSSAITSVIGIAFGISSTEYTESSQ
ncbi:hypothetical protein VU01_10989 [Candidatus Electrothrix marina]|uniref:Uncharacterized protein n=1 Tax=Candidatus Electrothrix marina TaxID=1859130 RepID=A0A444JF25_9BACT|nr:hypothetical protein VU01_10989 [Candidatus Electrothrix marina]